MNPMGYMFNVFYSQTRILHPWRRTLMLRPSQRSVVRFCFYWAGMLPETNIAPEHGWLEDDVSFRDCLFSSAMFRESIYA